MEFRLPELGEGVYEAEMVRWTVEAGAAVKPGQTLLEVMTDKATMEVPAPFAGVIQKLLVEPGQKLTIGQAILSYDEKSAGASQTPTPAKPAEERPAKPDAKSKSESPPKSEPPPKVEPKAKAEPLPTSAPTEIKAAPSVRQMARKLGVDLSQVHGTGPGGRILVGDLPSSGEVEESHPPPAKVADVMPVPARPTEYGTPGTRVKLQGLRRAIAEHMVQAKRTIPHFTYVDECDVTELVKLRESLKEAFAKKHARITYLAFVVKAVVAALREVPMVNASLNDEAGEIVLHDHYHIGFAVATPGGLIVPVIRDADKKSLLDIAATIERLSQDAREGKARLEDLRGGTFTITSIGNVGGLFATPIILHPQVGILGIGKIVKRPVYDEHGQLKAADMVYLSWSFDHRVLDGAVGTTFGNAVIRHLQKPAMLMVD